MSDPYAGRELGIDGNYIYGIGDEAVIALTAVFMLASLLVLCYISFFRPRRGHIAHSAQQSVNEARNIIQNERGRDDGNSSGGVEQDEPTQRDGEDAEVCPICIDVAEYAVLTNCGHTFCGECILQYSLVLAARNSSLHCPCCRRLITILQPWLRAGEREGDDSGLRARINTFNRRNSDNLPVWERVRDIPALLRGVAHNLSFPLILRIAVRTKFILALCIASLYLILPTDLIPESIFGILGLVDDLFVLTVVLLFFLNIYRGYIREG